ncbi:MAG: hypothetical protein IE886_06640 [Campylobacterales bacterium]|nr:hypothetical protein [Campylobacterales bacterium]
MTRILGPMLLAARGLLATFNTAESTYAHRDPARTVGSFRFKLTRQWVSVSTPYSMPPVSMPSCCRS